MFINLYHAALRFTLAFFLCLSMMSAASASTLDDFTKAWAQISRYHVTVVLSERLSGALDSRVFDYQFQKPEHVLMRVVAGKNKGATLSWNGGPTLVARKGSGLMEMFSKTFSLHDPLVTTIRGSSIDELSYGAILAHLRKHQGGLKTFRSVADAGVHTMTLEILSVSAANDNGFNREDVVLSEKTHLPIRVLGYENGVLVRQVEFHLI